MKLKSIALAVAIALALPAVSAFAEAETPAKECRERILAAPWLAWAEGVTDAKPLEALSAGNPQQLALSQNGPSGLYEGSYTLSVSAAGKYSFALERPAWIDVSKGGEALKPQSFGHGPDCSGIRKIVSFDLAAGNYQVQIRKSQSPKMRLLILAN
jgi:hypothetical protein